jgi:tRNA nucleotidyltransferase (CCA-adding enzyme)
MINTLPEKLKTLATRCPFPLYVVGGTCRDHIAGLKSQKNDYDICAPASAENFENIAKDAGFAIASTYKNTGTVKLVADGIGYEFTCFRSDKYVRGKHNPEQIYFTDDIEKDARRRDFKCNAVYYDIKAKKFVDPLGGINEIKQKLISTVVDPDKVFGEDGLRLMRLCRQAAQLGFEPTAECLDGAKRNSQLINDISAERIWAELYMILLADKKYGVTYGQYHGLKLLQATGVLQVILPELALGDGMEQRKDFHDHDVLEHSLRCVKYADESIRLAALLHDVGKPKCFLETGKFTQHDIVGEQLAGEICDRLKVSTKQKQLAMRLTKLHMYDLNCQAKENKIRKFIVDNFAILPQLLLIKQADFSACKDNMNEAPCVTKWKNIIKKMQSEGAPFTTKQLKIRGDELIALGLPPQKTAETLHYMLEECAMNARLNQRDRLIHLAFNDNYNVFNDNHTD